MQRPLQCAVVLMLAVASPLTVQAQLKPLTAPTATRPVTVTPPAGKAPAPGALPGSDQAIRERLGSHPINSEGPSDTPVIAQPAAPLRVYDSKGRLRNGMTPAGQNRVLDTRTGRYHDTVPSGDGQRIVR